MRSTETSSSGHGIASVPPQGVGAGAGEITTWNLFYSDQQIIDYKAIIASKTALASMNNIIRNYGDDQIRALWLLHEVAHETGLLPDNHQGPWGSNPDAQRAFEKELALKCPV